MTIQLACVGENCAWPRGVRWNGELRTARRKDIEIDGAEWRYTVTKTNTPHIVPCPAAVEYSLNCKPYGSGACVSRDVPMAES